MTGGRPTYLQWRFLGIVAVGGTLGTAIRELLSLLIPSVVGLPVAIFGINVLGALALGALLEALARRGPDEGRLRALRLLLGTGVLGGFTTYSALATDTSLLLATDHAAAALIYSLASLIVGALATWAGVAMAASLHHRREVRARETEAVRWAPSSSSFSRSRAVSELQRGFSWTDSSAAGSRCPSPSARRSSM